MHAMMSEAARRELFDDLLEAAAVALSSPEKLAPDEIEQVRRARNAVLLLAGKLVKGANPPAALMLPIIEAAYIIGKYCVVTRPVERFIGQARAEHARDASRQTPKEIAIRQAILAECATAAVTHPYKTAEACLAAVNARVSEAAEAGGWAFEPLSAKALGGRLKRLSEGADFSRLLDVT
jgi:hypothetical protein